jgi:hypothetical protein
LLGFAVVANAIGLFWVPRLPKARELEDMPEVVDSGAAGKEGEAPA